MKALNSSRQQMRERITQLAARLMAEDGSKTMHKPSARLHGKWVLLIRKTYLVTAKSIKH